MVWYDPIKFPDVRAVLEAALGELALFEAFSVAPADPERRLPAWRIRRLAQAYAEVAEAEFAATGDVDHPAQQARVRAALAAEGFTAAVIEEELARVLKQVFAVPGWRPMDDWILIDAGSPLPMGVGLAA